MRNQNSNVEFAKSVLKLYEKELFGSETKKLEFGIDWGWKFWNWPFKIVWDVKVWP